MRKFASVIALSAFAMLGGCTAAQIATLQADVSAVESDIQVGAAKDCGIIPTLETITTAAGVLFPGAASIAAIGVAGEQTVESYVCSVSPPAASARYKALPRASAAGAPVTIGVTKDNVVVKGWRT